MLIRNTNTSLKKKRKFFCTNIWESENVFPFLFIFVVFFPCSSVQYFFDAVRNQISSRKCLLELVKRASKVYQKNVSRERFLDFDQLKKNSENYMLIRDCNWIRTQNHLVRKRTLDHLAKLAKWLSCVQSTYLYGAFGCMFLSCRVRVSEWIHTLWLPPECQGSLCSKQARSLDFQWLQLDLNPEPLGS